MPILLWGIGWIVECERGSLYICKRVGSCEDDDEKACYVPVCARGIARCAAQDKGSVRSVLSSRY